MFDVNGSHIAQLNDTDLRTLIARLCEAELRRAGLPVSAVTAGGDQNAADGGLDVRVDLPASTNISGFIPRPVTGFQVKVSDMPRAKILKEIRPKGRVRRVIKDLASVAGAYVIVSAKGSTSDSVLEQRCKAMLDAVRGTHGVASLKLCFYDRDRVASWVRDHPGMVVWVRERIGQSIRGWRPYQNWAASHEPMDAEYLIDGKFRMHYWRSQQENGLNVETGIQQIRGTLAPNKGVVRLVGLSGTGKTRMVQALFDQRIGSQALDPALAIYTDSADTPDPSPRDLMHHLIQNGQRAIIIVDNCPPDTHRSLARTCVEPECTLSLITVEYDVGDDTPEGTEVFRLEPASDEVIEKLLERRSSQLSQLDCRRITEFSGGNARMALALAHTVRCGVSVSDLTDGELIDRLFLQRHAQDDRLLRAGEVCSLVYSFNGEEITGQNAELPFLANLCEMTADQLYRHVAELKRRDLVQQRGQWRAVLPHALANRLARNCLENMPPGRVADSFLKSGSERLLRSFSRRLGYLHDSQAAQRIVQAWLASGGILADIAKLDDLRTAMFRNVAPVAPEAALSAIEDCLNGDDSAEILDVSNHNRHTWVALLKSIAYDPNLFERAAFLLARFVAAEPPDYRYDPSRDHFASLFWPALSGTHASISQRLKIVEAFITADDPTSQAIGLEALDALLKTSHFMSGHSFEFGARPRDYGWQPKSGEEFAGWYGTAIAYAKRLALSGDQIGNGVRAILAKHFRGLWTRAGVVDEIESTAIEIAAQGFWPEGWIAVRSTIRFDIKDMPPEYAHRIHSLEEVLRPRDLLQKTQAYVFPSPHSAVDIVDGEVGDEGAIDGSSSISAYDRVQEIAVELGREVANNASILDQLLPDLFSLEIQRGWYFGGGLASGADQPQEIWERLVDALVGTPEHKRDIQVLMGFIHAVTERDAEVAGRILDDAVVNPVLGTLFPILQASVHIDKRGVYRLETSLKLGLASVWAYRQLSCGKAADAIPASALRRLLLRIASKADGYAVAADILRMRLFSVQRSGTDIGDEIIQCGQELLKRCPFDRSPGNPDHDLGRIAETCLTGADAASTAAHICRQFKSALSGHRVFASDYHELMKSILRLQPAIALDEFLDEKFCMPDVISGGRMFEEGNLLDVAPVESLITWAQANPSIRFPRLASVIPYYTEDANKDLEWSATALRILDLAPDRERVLDEFGSRFRPRGGWLGSLREVLESRRALISAFMEHNDPVVVSWAKKMEGMLGKMIADAHSHDRSEDLSFE